MLIAQLLMKMARLQQRAQKKRCVSITKAWGWKAERQRRARIGLPDRSTLLHNLESKT